MTADLVWGPPLIQYLSPKQKKPTHLVGPTTDRSHANILTQLEIFSSSIIHVLQKKKVNWRYYSSLKIATQLDSSKDTYKKE